MDSIVGGVSTVVVSNETSTIASIVVSTADTSADSFVVVFVAFVGDFFFLLT